MKILQFLSQVFFPVFATFGPFFMVSGLVSSMVLSWVSSSARNENFYLYSTMGGIVSMIGAIMTGLAFVMMMAKVHELQKHLDEFLKNKS